MQKKVRQAVVMIHGMGEQRPLETLNEFIGVGLKPAADGQRHFYSRPDSVTDSYEARRYLAPRSEHDGVELHAQVMVGSLVARDRSGVAGWFNKHYGHRYNKRAAA